MLSTDTTRSAAPMTRAVAGTVSGESTTVKAAWSAAQPESRFRAKSDTPGTAANLASSCTGTSRRASQSPDLGNTRTATPLLDESAEPAGETVSRSGEAAQSPTTGTLIYGTARGMVASVVRNTCGS